MQEETKQSAFIWAMGAVCGLAVGVVVALVIRDRRRSLDGVQPASINIWNVPGMPQGYQIPAPMTPIPVTQAVNAQTVASSRPTRLETFTLSTDPTNPSRLVTASSQRHWSVELRNIGPPGSFAVISTDPSYVTFPATNSIVIPAGGDNRVRLAPREALFAIGSVGGVTLSCSSSEDLA